MCVERNRTSLNRRLAWVFPLALALFALGCQAVGGSTPMPAKASPSRLSQILESGALRVGISADLPPLSMKGNSGEYIGFEVDLATALAEGMGLDAQFVQKPFAELIPALQGGEVDIVLAGLTITPERNAKVAFAGPYFISGTSIVAKADKLDSMDRLATLDVAGRTYAALAESTSAAFVESNLPNAKLVTVSEYEEGVQKVLAGEVDAMVADHLACSMAVWRHPDAGLKALRRPFTIEPLGIALPADSPLLLNLVENYLKTLKATGLLARFKARWLADGSWLADLP